MTLVLVKRAGKNTVFHMLQSLKQWQDYYLNQVESSRHLLKHH